MSWKYESHLEKEHSVRRVCNVSIYSEDWELYTRLVKIVEKELDIK